MQYDYGQIQEYLIQMKESVEKGRYRIARNRSRQANLDLYREYVIDEEMSRQILLSLQAEDFCEILQNQHTGYEYERLYVFGKTVLLLQRFGTEEEPVPLYIKCNKLEDQFVIVISFHKQAHPLRYAFQPNGIQEGSI